VGEHLSKQLLRSGTALALNYGETQGAESFRDFIHISSIVLKELRESNVNLKIIKGISICNNNELLDYLVDESNQLVKVFL
jgi:four helix bundle protein